MFKIAFLVNRLIKNFDTILTDIQTNFKDTNYQLYFSDYQGHLVDIAQKVIKEGFNTIITVGGDGTHNEVINGILQSFKKSDGVLDYDWEGLRKIRLGLLPSGTGNDFSKSIFVKNSASQLKTMIESGQSKLIDLGWASFYNTEKKATTRFFINITDVGMGGEVARKLQNKIPYLSNKSQYGIRIVTTFLTYNKTAIKANAEGFEWKGNVMNFIVANGKWFGNGLGVAPNAILDDGLFDIAILGDIGIIDYLTHLGTVKKGELVIHPEVSYHTVSEIRIEPTDKKDLAIDMDGEFVGIAPLTIKNLPKTINFIC